MTAALKAAAPDGVDLYFDNTGGHVTTAVFDVFNKFGRMVLCGVISEYNNASNKAADNLAPNVLYALTASRLRHSPPERCRRCRAS